MVIMRYHRGLTCQLSSRECASSRNNSANAQRKHLHQVVKTTVDDTNRQEFVVERRSAGISLLGIGSSMQIPKVPLRELKIGSVTFTVARYFPPDWRPPCTVAVAPI